jgi:hypothetical protein
VAAGAILFLSHVGAAGESRLVGTLTADREYVVWREATGDTLRGRHDSFGQVTQTLHRLKSVWGEDGLHTASGAFPSTALSVRVSAISSSRAEVVFGLADSLAPSEDLLWSSGQAVSIAAGDVWLGDVVVFDAGTTIAGEVIGDVVALGGNLTIGEAATVRGDVILVGGTLRQSGDAKIYGRIFAPGGHRRPRLTISRAWEFEDQRLKLYPTLSYDRVDGLQPGAGIGFQRSAFTPRLEFWSGYGFASKAWQFRLDLRQRLLEGADVEAVGSVFRMTQTDDDSTVSRNENTVFAAVCGSDYRDYYGADGGELSVIYKYRERGVLTLRYRNVDYRQMDAHPNLWHLFRPNHDFEANFTTLPDQAASRDFHGRSSSVAVELAIVPLEIGVHPLGFNGRLGLVAEIAGGLLGGKYDYERIMADACGWWDSGRWHHVKLRALYGAGRHNLPPNKLFYLGGLGTLPGYSQKSFSGSEAFLAQAEYQFNYWQNRFGDAALILFADFGRTASDIRFWNLGGSKADVGIGLQFADAIRIDAAKGLDRARRDIRVSVRLTPLR